MKSFTMTVAAMLIVCVSVSSASAGPRGSRAPKQKRASAKVAKSAPMSKRMAAATSKKPAKKLRKPAGIRQHASGQGRPRLASLRANRHRPSLKQRGRQVPPSVDAEEENICPDGQHWVDIFVGDEGEDNEQHYGECVDDQTEGD